MTRAGGWRTWPEHPRRPYAQAPFAAPMRDRSVREAPDSETSGAVRIREYQDDTSLSHDLHPLHAYERT